MQARRFVGLELLEHAQALAGDFIDDAAPGLVIPGGKQQRPLAAEALQVAEPSVHVARMGDHHEQSPRRPRGQRRGSESGGRTPGSVDGGAFALGKGRQDGVEAFRFRQQRGEIGEALEPRTRAQASAFSRGEGRKLRGWGTESCPLDEL